jgi:predicted nucleic acid-binding protein
MQPDDFLDWTYFVFSNLIVLPRYILSEQCLAKTQKLLEKIDLKDTSYVALAMKLVCCCLQETACFTTV